MEGKSALPADALKALLDQAEVLKTKAISFEKFRNDAKAKYDVIESRLRLAEENLRRVRDEQRSLQQYLRYVYTKPDSDANPEKEDGEISDSSACISTVDAYQCDWSSVGHY